MNKYLNMHIHKYNKYISEMSNVAKIIQFFKEYLFVEYFMFVNILYFSKFLFLYFIYYVLI